MRAETASRNAHVICACVRCVVWWGSAVCLGMGAVQVHICCCQAQLCDECLLVCTAVVVVGVVAVVAVSAAAAAAAAAAAVAAAAAAAAAAATAAAAAAAAA